MKAEESAAMVVTSFLVHVSVVPFSSDSRREFAATTATCVLLGSLDAAGRRRVRRVFQQETRTKSRSVKLYMSTEWYRAANTAKKQQQRQLWVTSTWTSRQGKDMSELTYASRQESAKP